VAYCQTIQSGTVPDLYVHGAKGRRISCVEMKAIATPAQG
jgi:hypothetical protein